MRNEVSRFRDGFGRGSNKERCYQKLNFLREELGDRDISDDCVQFIQHLLVLDPKQRPTASPRTLPALDHYVSTEL